MSIVEEMTITVMETVVNTIVIVEYAENNTLGSIVS